MSEKLPGREGAPEVDPYQALETLVAHGQWTPEAEARVRALIESHTADMYMIYVTYRESGLVGELPAHERQLYEVLRAEFADESEK